MAGERRGRLYVAIASYDVRKLRVCRKYLEEHSPLIECRCYSRGRALLDELGRENDPDIIVLGSQLEDMDEAQFVSGLRGLYSKPLLLLPGEGRHGRNTASCLRSDGNCYIIEQTELADLMQELCRVSGYGAAFSDELCRSLLAGWGIHKLDTKCAYLICALRVACASSEKLAIRKEILRKVGEEYNVSEAAVESGIRRVVDKLEQERTASWLEFKRSSGFGDARPTTGRLVYAVKAHLLACGLGL